MYSEKIGLIFWGSKGQYAVFCHNDVVQPQDAPIRNTIKDIRQILTLQWPGKDFWALEFCGTNGVRYKTYTLYRSSYDGARRGSFIAVTLYVPNDIHVENSCGLLKDMMNMYFAEYMDLVYNTPIAGKYDDIQPYTAKLREYEWEGKIRSCKVQYGMHPSVQNDVPDVYLYDDEARVQSFFDDPYDRRFFECQEVMFISRELYESGVFRFSITPKFITDQELKGKAPATRLEITIPGLPNCHLTNLKISGEAASFSEVGNLVVSEDLVNDSDEISFEIVADRYETFPVAERAGHITKSNQDGITTFYMVVHARDIKPESNEIAIHVKAGNKVFDNVNVVLWCPDKNISKKMSDGKIGFRGTEVDETYHLHLEWCPNSYIPYNLDVKPSDYLQKPLIIEVAEKKYTANEYDRPRTVVCVFKDLSGEGKEGQIVFDKDGKMQSFILIPAENSSELYFKDTDEYTVICRDSQVEITPKPCAFFVKIDGKVFDYLWMGRHDLSIVDCDATVSLKNGGIYIEVDCDKKGRVKEVCIDGGKYSIRNIKGVGNFIRCLMIEATSDTRYDLEDYYQRVSKTINREETILLPDGVSVYKDGKKMNKGCERNSLLEKITFGPDSAGNSSTNNALMMNSESLGTDGQGDNSFAGSNAEGENGSIRRNRNTGGNGTEVYAQSGEIPDNKNVGLWTRPRIIAGVVVAVAVVAVVAGVCFWMFKPQKTITFIFSAEDTESKISKVENKTNKLSSSCTKQNDSILRFSMNEKFKTGYEELAICVEFKGEGILNYSLTPENKDSIKAALDKNVSDTILVKLKSPAMCDLDTLDLLNKPGALYWFVDKYKDFLYTPNRAEKLWERLKNACGGFICGETFSKYNERLSGINSSEFRKIYQDSIMKLDSVAKMMHHQFEDLCTKLASLDVTKEHVEDFESICKILGKDDQEGKISAYKSFFNMISLKQMPDSNTFPYDYFSNKQQEILKQTYLKNSMMFDNTIHLCGASFRKAHLLMKELKK